MKKAIYFLLYPYACNLPQKHSRISFQQDCWIQFTVSTKLKSNYYLSATEGIGIFAGNKKYFNRRITMYPGPGILPADEERSIYLPR